MGSVPLPFTVHSFNYVLCDIPIKDDLIGREEEHVLNLSVFFYRFVVN